MVTSVCIFGDSLAKGVVWDRVKNRYVFLKDCCVNLFSKECNVRIANYAKFGCTISKGIEIFEKNQEKLLQFDRIAIEFGGNDCNFDWAAIAAAPDQEHLPETPLSVFEACYRDLLFRIKELGGKPIIINLPPIHSKTFLDWVSKGISRENILKWLGDEEAIFRWHAGYNDAIERIAKEMETPLVDIRSEFLAFSDYSHLLCEDGMHLNAEGHQMVCRKLTEYAKAQHAIG